MFFRHVSRRGRVCLPVAGELDAEDYSLFPAAPLLIFHYGHFCCFKDFIIKLQNVDMLTSQLINTSKIRRSADRPAKRLSCVLTGNAESVTGQTEADSNKVPYYHYVTLHETRGPDLLGRSSFRPPSADFNYPFINTNSQYHNTITNALTRE